MHKLAQQQRRGRDEITRVCKVLSVYVLPWHTAAVETRDAVAARHNLLPAAAEPGVLALRDAIARCVDVNAAAGWSGRAGLDRTRIDRIVVDAAALVDRNSLEHAQQVFRGGGGPASVAVLVGPGVWTLPVSSSRASSSVSSAVCCRSS